MSTRDQQNAGRLRAVMRSLVAIIPTARRKAWREELAEAARAKSESPKKPTKDTRK